MNNRLLFLDTETGGINPQKHSLLSVGVVVWDDSEGVLYADEFYLRSEHYSVTAQATRINHFDEIDHNNKACEPKQVVSRLIELKDSFFSEYQSMPLAGHNIGFDVQFLKQLFLTCNRSYEKVFSHRLVDTYSILKFLVDCQLIPNSINSSASAFKHFGIKVVDRHTALGDAYATMQLYTKLIELIEQAIWKCNVE